MKSEIKLTLKKVNKILRNPDNFTEKELIACYKQLDFLAQEISKKPDVTNVNYRVELIRKLDVLWSYIPDKIEMKKQVNCKLYSPSVTGINEKNPDDISSFIWSNTQLLKDCGLSGYTLAKELGGESIMFVCSKHEEYPYLTDLPALKLIYSDGRTVDELGKDFLDVFRREMSNIDILILYGAQKQMMRWGLMYHKARPNGKIYCALDMNSSWMAEIEWNSREMRAFSEACSLIATSCTSIRDSLNNNPNVCFPCRFLSNGFYNSSNTLLSTSSTQKENVIITVGRIGIKVKNHEALIIAFGSIAKKIEGWKLKLIGPVDPLFEEKLAIFFKDNPWLKSKIIITGEITDKKELYNEYSKAKIFALTSVSEGFPNVYAEALFHGCNFITSDIDAAQDMINFGQLGQVYTNGNTKELSEKLLAMCADLESSFSEDHVEKCRTYGRRYFDWERNAKMLSFALFQDEY